MSTTTTSEFLKKRASKLQEELRKIQEQDEKNRRRKWEIQDEIRELQAKCPHENTNELPVHDCAEMKYLNFCTACGAEVRG